MVECWRVDGQFSLSINSRRMASRRNRDTQMAAQESITKVFEYRIRPHRKFVAEADNILWRCRELYNACLEQRISRYVYAGETVSRLEQCRQLTELRAADPVFAGIPRHIQAEVVKRLDRAYSAFFRRVKSGQIPGFPRFKGRERYNSFEYAVDQRHNCPLQGDKLRIAGVGTVRVRLSRPIEGAIKIVRVVRRADGWYAQLVCVMDKPEPLPKTGQVVGVDVGIKTFAALSTGEFIENPRCLKRNEEKLEKASQRLSRRTKGGKRRAKARRLLAKHHLHVQRARKHFHHQTAYRLVQRFDEIHVEDLRIGNMLKNKHLAKAIAGVAWGQFFLITFFKAVWAGRLFVKKIARRTSMTCSDCGHVQKMPLALRIFVCGSCGAVKDRDTNASDNILRADCSPSVERRLRTQRQTVTEAPAGRRARA